MDIKILRKKFGLTQLQLAVKLKVDTGTISRWERELHKPTHAVQRRIDRLHRRLDKQGNGNEAAE